MNFSESSGLARQFTEAGYEVVDFSEKADLYVVNTCTVTAAAEKKGRQVIHAAHRANPQAQVAVVGCFSELRPEEVAKIEGVDYVLGSADKHLLLERIREREASGETVPGYSRLPVPFIPERKAVAAAGFVASYSTLGRTRSFFKVQDGCDNFCTYCAIPYARGRSRSARIDQTLQTAREIVAQGVQEIVLTGVNIGDFGRKNGENLAGLLQALEKLPGLERIRIGSVEPDLLSDEIIDFLAASGKCMPHFHIPLQSGSDEVLRLMHRRYDTALFADKVHHIKERMPWAFIGVDVMVGCRGELPEYFDHTYHFLESLPVTQLHVFPYSERPGTAALRIPYVVEEAEKKRRSTLLLELSDRKTEAFYAAHRGREAEVLFEKAPAGKAMHGFTRNYVRVELSPGEARPEYDNQLKRVKLGDFNADHTALRVEAIL